MREVVQPAIVSIILIVTLLRVNILIRGDRWILRNGASWRNALSEKALQHQRSPPAQQTPGQQVSAQALTEKDYWDAFEDHNGKEDRQLFFGPKSYRLRKRAAKKREEGKRRSALATAGFDWLWRWFIFAPVLSAVIVVVASTAPHYVSGSRWLWLIIAEVLQVGSIAIAAEVTICSGVMKAWGTYYHAYPTLPYSRSSRALLEMRAYIGGGIVAIFTSVALFSVVSDLFNGFYGPKNVLILISDTLSALGTFGSPVAQSSVDALAEIALIATSLGYLIVALLAAGRALNSDSDEA